MKELGDFFGCVRFLVSGKISNGVLQAGSFCIRSQQRGEQLQDCAGAGGVPRGGVENRACVGIEYQGGNPEAHGLNDKRGGSSDERGGGLQGDGGGLLRAVCQTEFHGHGFGDPPLDGKIAALVEEMDQVAKFFTEANFLLVAEPRGVGRGDENFRPPLDGANSARLDGQGIEAR